MYRLLWIAAVCLFLAAPAWAGDKPKKGDKPPKGDEPAEAAEKDAPEAPSGSLSKDEVEALRSLLQSVEGDDEGDDEDWEDQLTPEQVERLLQLLAEEEAATEAEAAPASFFDDQAADLPATGDRTWHGPVDEPKPPRPTWSDFVNTTLTFYIGDDNLLAGNEDGSPNLGMANEYPELFFEGLNAEKQAVVSESHLVLYGGSAGYLPFVETEGAFVAEFELTRDPDDNQLIGRFRDDGSYIGVEFFFNKSKTGPSLKLTAWPYSADRFRLGYTYDLTWGGNTIWTRNRGPVPGFKLNLDLEKFYVFIGAKALVRLRADNNETENYWGLLAGLGPNFELGKDFKLQYDAGGGYFYRGTFQQDPFRSTPLTAFGVSQRVQLTVRTKMGLSPALRDLKNTYDNFSTSRTIVPNYEGVWGFGVGFEFTTLWQSLIDANSPDSLHFDNAVTFGAFAQARFLKSMRVGVDVVYRDVSFLVFNVPGLTPYLGFATDTIRSPQVYGALWWDWYIPAAHITPGVQVGVMQPASFSSAEGGDGSRQLEVIREANDYEIMPSEIEGAFTILSGKASLKWHLSSILAIIGEVSYTQDFNNSKVVTDPDSGVGVRQLDEAQAQRLGLNLLIQASF